MKNLSFLAVAFALTACGANDKKSNSTSDQDFRLAEDDGASVVDGYAYELSGDSCTTGFHGPTTLADYCAVLLDDGKNANCAKAARLDLHKQDCAGK